jgi:hypothetical protein
VTGLQRARVAELIVTTPDGRQRGSGYRVTTDAVLTAAHVLANAESVQVRFSSDLPDEWTVTATSWWVGSSDLAVVEISGEPVEPALFGQVGDRAAVIPVQAVGFPLWKFREDYRDAFHATGTVAVLSNWRSGTLEVSLSPGPDAPWNGMSGAALWCGDRIVGVITEHHPHEGAARLTATRVDQALLDRLGVQVWPDVVRDAPADRVLSAYRAQLSETAPPELLDREAELDELVRFCAGSSPYLWLQAGPWAGKSALLSSFVLRCLPRGVDVVSFFITSRFAGQSDSDAFTESIIEQLAALVDEPAASLLQSPARRGHMARLLQEAAERSVETGRRLLVVVDGLDEDTGRSSIAALLPASVPPGVRVLVASRPHPGLPEDVPANHPLRTLTPRPLTGSPYARDIAMRAKHELRAALHGSDHERTTLGLIVASGGGLTRADLEEVTGWAPYELDQVLEGRLARSLTHRVSSSLYVFSHETLREIAHQQLGATLTTYRNQLHAWAERYAGWPATTPIYLMRGYPRILAATGDFPRLLALATDQTRHERLLAYSGGDALAQIEIANAIELAAHEQDIGALLKLAVLQAELVDRNFRIPHDLPAVWVTLGEPTRALALAQGIGDDYKRADALVAMAEAAYPDDRYRADRRIVDKIEREIKKIEHGFLRDRTVMLLAIAAAHGGWHDDATRLAAGIERQDWKLEAQAACAVASGDLDFAADLAGGIDDGLYRARALVAVAKAAVAQGDLGRVRGLAQAAEQAFGQQDVEWDFPYELPTELACLLGIAGDKEYRDKLLADTFPGRGFTTELPTVTQGAILEGDRDRARQLVADAEHALLKRLQLAGSESPDRPDAMFWHDMSAAAKAMGMVGDFDRAERFISKIARPEIRDEALAELVRLLAADGEHDRGEWLADTIGTPEAQAQAMTWVAAARRGRHARQLLASAEHHARHAAGSWQRAFVVAKLVKPVSAAGAHECAQRLAFAADRLARQLTPGGAMAYALCDVIEAVGAILGREHIRDIAAQARAEARSTAGLISERTESRVVVALARADDVDATEQFALEFGAVPARWHAFAESVSVMARAGDAGGARRLTTVMERQFQQATNDQEYLARPSMVKALIEVGDYDKAQLLTEDPAEVQAAQAIALAVDGDLGGAGDLAASALQGLRSESSPATRLVAEALAVVGKHDLALDMARLADRGGTTNGRRAVAMRLAQGGQVRRAEEFIAGFAGDPANAEILADMAEVVPEEVARRLVIEVLTSEHWRPAVSLAARLIGSQVVEIAEFLLD